MDCEYDSYLITKEKLSVGASSRVLEQDSINEILKNFPDVILDFDRGWWILDGKNFIEHFKNNDVESVNILLNYCNFPDFNSLLPMAVMYSNDDMVNYFLPRCVDIVCDTYYSVTIACTRVDNPELLSILLDHEFGTNKIDVNYLDGLFMAQSVVSNNIPAIKILLDHGFDMESHGDKFLYLALRDKAYESFHYLVIDPDSFVESLVEDFPCLITNFVQYVNEYGIELHPDSLRKLIQKN
jgi:hypothetical protein